MALEGSGDPHVFFPWLLHPEALPLLVSACSPSHCTDVQEDALGSDTLYTEKGGFLQHIVYSFFLEGDQPYCRALLSPPSTM